MKMNTHRCRYGLLIGALLLSSSLFGVEPASSEQTVSNTMFAIFDTETTGLSPTQDRIVEVAVVRYQNGKILDQKTWLLNPEINIPWYATKVHGIANDMVQDQPSFGSIVPEFESFIKGCVMMAHNAPFDINFVNQEYKRMGQPRLSNEVIDSLALFRRWYPELPSHSLKSVADHEKVLGDDFHRALADSVFVTRIFDKGLQRNNYKKLQDVFNECGGPLTF
jgi:DNA polymerase III epsilon subunit family exonuclease